MIQGFWKTLRKPFFVMAPMANVTDAAFRRVIAKYGKPDAFFTEFVSAHGLCSEVKDHLLVDMMFNKSERPVILQIFGSNPEFFHKSAEMGRKMGFDGIDINTGCPDRAVLRQGAGCALVKEPKLMKEIIHATKEGAKTIPVSVKTRLGWNESIIEEWAGHLLEAEPAAITIHARTKKQMSDVPPDWNEFKKAVVLRNQMKSETLILGNGDLVNLDDARKKCEETGADGMMLGRAIFGNPWLFSKKVQKKDLSYKEILDVMVEHAELFESIFGDKKNFLIMRKHFGAYVSGFSLSKKLRVKLMEAEDVAQVKDAVSWYLKEIEARDGEKELTDPIPQTWRPHY